MTARADDVAIADDAQRGQSLGAARCCAIRSETPEEYRTRTKHQWKKHQNAEDNMMRWMWPRNGKQRRRQRKWMREYERTLYAIPKPNIPENTYRQTQQLGYCVGMKTNQIKVGQKVKYLVTRTLQTVKAYRPARKDHFGDILTPATIVFETPDGTCWDNAENFEVVQ